MSKMKIFSSILILTFAGAVGWLYQITPGHLKTPPGLTERLSFLDRRGLEIRAYAPGESYEWISLKEVPRPMIDLLLLAEDRHFYSHSGVDLKGSMRSLWQNLKSFSIQSGASTIDQQVYREAHQIPRNFLGKLKVMMGAWKINQAYSKDEILRTYLNTLPYAHQVNGVKRASEVLFGKELGVMSVSEYAAMAVLPRSPGLLSHPNFNKLLNAKKNLLLSEYLKNQQDLNFEKKIVVKIQKDYSGWENFHFVSKLLKRSDLSRYISQGKIETTLDLFLQREVSEILRTQMDELKDLRVSHGAVVVVENSTGDILSYVGSQDILSSKAGFIDALEVKRQPGSALKPLTYALALMSGKTLGDVLPDVPSYYKTGLGQFLPRNYDQNYSGPRLMREALANSLNLPAVALTDELGVENVYEFYKNLGIDLPQEAHHYGVGLTLGNVEITPLNLAMSYTSFPNGGSRTALRSFLSEPVNSTETRLTPEVAEMIGDVLSDSVARREEFGDKNPFDLPFTFSVKTGTSTDFRDNWAVGYNQRYTIVVWVGNMDQKGMKKVSGITGAGPVLAKVARYLMKDKFLPPKTIGTLEKHEICALSGMKPGPHCSHRKTELFIAGTHKETLCDYHISLAVHDCHESGDIIKLNVAKLPDLYQKFTVDRPEWSLEAQVAKLCSQRDPQIEKSLVASLNKVQIGRPLNESIYALDPNLPRQLQRLKLQLEFLENVKKVEWKNNGTPIHGKSLSTDWVMEKGKHHFEAEVFFEDGRKELSPVINVTVL